jgi:NitT/TauT family transport system substrate-binding protein
MWKHSSEVYPDHEASVLIYGPSMEGKREAGQRFMVGYLRGVRDFKEEGLTRRDPAVIEVAVKWTSIRDPELWQKMELQEANPDGYNYRASLEEDLQWFVANGFVPRAPRLEDVLDQTYVDYALSRLGRYKPGCASNPCP